MTDQPTPAQDSPLRQRIAEAVDELFENGGVYAIDDAERDRLVTAFLAVRDRYLEQLAAGRETWKRKAGEIEADRDRLEAEVAAARKFAAEMRDFCSPHGVAVDYADRLIEAMDRAKEGDR
jgi:hypothetical protein